jgi:hypothetical protein
MSRVITSPTAAPARARLTVDERDYLLIHLLRSPRLFAECRAVLDLDDGALAARLQRADPAFAVVWGAAHALVGRRPDGRLPEPLEAAEMALEVEVKRLLTLATEPLSPPDEERLLGGAEGGLLRVAFTVPELALNVDGAREFLTRFLEELTVYDPFRDYVVSWGRLLPSSLDPFLEKLQQRRAQLVGLGEKATVNAFPGVYKRVAQVRVPTAVPFLDRLLKGGTIPGNVYMLLGPTGGGKTTLAVQVFVDGALYQLVNSPPPQLPGDWYYYNYEGSVEDELLPRIWAYSAQIEYDTFLDGRDLSNQSRGDYKPYEKRRFAHLFRMGAPVPGEEERLLAQATLLGGKNLHPKDFSGAFPGVGMGGVEEIALNLEREVADGRRPVGVVIDYAGLMVENHLEGKPFNSSDYYAVLKQVGNKVRRLIAERFKCTVWLLHQLAMGRVPKSPGNAPHHSDAAGSRNFGENAAGAFTLGTIDDNTGCLLVSLSKGRHKDPTTRPVLVRLDGAVRRMTDASGDYAVHPTTGRLVPKDDLHKIDRSGSKSRPARPAGMDFGLGGSPGEE